MPWPTPFNGGRTVGSMGLKEARARLTFAASNSSKASGAIIRSLVNSSCSPKEAATPGASISIGMVTRSRVQTGAIPPCFTRCRAAITSKASPSMARCTIRTHSAISIMCRTRASKAVMSLAAAFSIRAALL